VSRVETTCPRWGGGQRQAVASMEDSLAISSLSVESNYRVKKNRANRPSPAYQWGGMHSSAISAQYTKTFDYVGIFSAPPISTMRAGSNEEAVKRAEEFVNKLKTQQANGFKLYWIACGNTDFLLPGRDR